MPTTPQIASRITRFLGLLLSLTAACGQVTMPVLTDAPQPQARPVIPASVTLLFDDSVHKAMFEQYACGGELWKGNLGKAIVRAFEETGRIRFAHVSVEDGTGTVQTASSPTTPHFTAAIKLTQASFNPKTRTGAEDYYVAQVDIGLVSLFTDASGQEVPEAPMAYSKQVNIWTPQFGRGECGTQQLEGVITDASEYLADQFTRYVAELTAKTQRLTVAGQESPGSSLPSRAASTLTIRATLSDENNNLALEGGEKVGVRIDVTNNGASPSGPMTVSLTGTPSLIDAFAGQLASPVQIASLQGGETTSTMLWGRLPTMLEGTRGELTVTVTPSNSTAGAAGSQTVIATLVPGGQRPASMASPALRVAPSVSSSSPDPDRYAVIVGLGLYRSPWPGWKEGLSFDRNGIASLFKNLLAVPEEQTLLLEDELAGQTDIEEALARWLPKRVTKDSTVFFYFAGQTLVNPTNGEIFLIPYDATPASTPFRLISLRFVQSRLQTLGTKLTLAILDSPTTVSTKLKDGKAKSSAPNWVADLDGSSGPKSAPVLQVSRLAGSLHKHNSLLDGLSGPADLDQNGTVTVGEWLRSLRGTAATAPTLPPPLSIQSIPLSRIQR